MQAETLAARLPGLEAATARIEAHAPANPAWLRCSEVAGEGACGKDLVVPENTLLLILPPYASELNTVVENVWQFLRQQARG